MPESEPGGLATPNLSWLGIMRLGLVQTALGAIFVLSTSTLNRVMVIELALPATLPGALIALHYAMQVLRPRLGYGSDVGGRRTPWIVGGMGILAAGGLLAACATALMKDHLPIGIVLAVGAFVLIGLGVGASGTALLVLIAKRTAPARRPAAATIVWVMMIAGFIVTAAIASKTLDPFSPGRLVAVAAAIAGAGFAVTVLAVWGIEDHRAAAAAPQADRDFRRALRDVWHEPQARRFAIFVFVSMLAYGGEELLIEPFAGALFDMTPGQTAKLSGMLHSGSLAGMILVAVAATGLRKTRLGQTWIGKTWLGSLQAWMIGGCAASGVALLALAALGIEGLRGPVGPVLFALGIANGAFAIAAIGSMMQLVTVGEPAKEGVRMGLWGAAQAIAFGGGGLVATLLSDLAHTIAAGQAGAYGAVFACQALVFLYAASLAFRLPSTARQDMARTPKDARSDLYPAAAGRR